MLLYRLLITLAAPVLAVLLLIRVVRRIESIDDFRQRMGIWNGLPSGDVIWLHGASNGELTSARRLIEGLLQRSPKTTLVLTCNSVNAKHMMLKWGLPKTHIRLAPLDLRWIYRRLLSRMNVQQFIILEADFWPNRVLAAKQLSIPTALVAGRMSAKSARKWQKFPSICNRMFGVFDLVCPQDAASQDRLMQVGVSSHVIGPQISLKSYYQANSTLGDHATRSGFWLAASTHEGEDELLLKAHVEAQKIAPTLRMILAPRHPKRADQILQTARALGLNVTQRSAGDKLHQPSDVYLADTLGEMALWYDAAATCFVAGSLVPKGGHTPFEPMTHDCAILHGPFLENFAESYAALSDLNGARQCETAQDIADNVLALLDAETSKQQCLNAREALSKGETLAPVLDALSQLSKT